MQNLFNMYLERISLPWGEWKIPDEGVDFLLSLIILT